MAKSEADVANESGPRVTEATRIPMSRQRMRLEVPEIEGYVLHWFADRPGRIAQAMQAGYEYVLSEEVQLNNFGLAEDLMKDGNTDLGSRVSIHGGSNDKGGSERLYLMKIKKEWYEADMKDREKVADKTIDSLYGGTVDKLQGSVADVSHRYVRHGDNIFSRRQKARGKPTS